ncbi:hypothetical protein Gotur_032990 [Gossypium turneri]
MIVGRKGKGVSLDALSYLMFRFLATFGKWSAHFSICSQKHSLR